VPGRAHAGDTGAHDDDIKVLSHEPTLSTQCRSRQHSVEILNSM
jgi:hypothetical protein